MVKHFDKITGVYVQLELPAEWGNPFPEINDNGEGLQDLVWSGWSQFLKTGNHNPLFGSLEDVTNGFDFNTLRCRITNFDSEEMLERSIDYAERAMHEAYEAIPANIRRKAKK